MKNQQINMRVSADEKKLLKETAEDLTMRTGERITMSEAILIAIKHIKDIASIIQKPEHYSTNNF